MIRWQGKDYPRWTDALEKQAMDLDERLYDVERLNAEVERLRAEIERLKNTDWRSCIDHIIRKDSPCPVCENEKLQARIERLEATIDLVMKYDSNLIDALAAEDG